MPKLFGTDGVRGVANTELGPELAVALGRAAADVLRTEGARPKVVVGRDTRVSGDMLASALAAGLLSAGADVVRGRVLPTPAVAFLVQELGATAGAVISASHNPAADNGIKFFGHDGFKLSDEQEQQIENRVGSELNRPVGADIGRLEFVPDANDRYVSHALKALEGKTLGGLKIVVDCANGAAYKTTPEALRRAGADVILIGAEPDGLNINLNCGSLTPEVVAEAVVANNADLGLCHDGDADRVIAVDERGNIVDGDCMLGAIAIDLKCRSRLPGNRVVSTVMANLGLRRAMAEAGIELIETSVGDRFVLEAMLAKGAGVGGEQSGHLIFLDHCTTGDGLVTGLKIAALMASTGAKLSEISRAVPKFPQVLLNLPVSDREKLQGADEVWRAVDEAQNVLADTGRVLVRASGTEPLVRVMVEADTLEAANRAAERIAAAVTEELGA